MLWKGNIYFTSMTSISEISLSLPKTVLGLWAHALLGLTSICSDAFLLLLGGYSFSMKRKKKANTQPWMQECGQIWFLCGFGPLIFISKWSQQREWKRALKKNAGEGKTAKLGEKGRAISLVIQLTSLFNKLRGKEEGRVSTALQESGKFFVFM